MVYVELFDKIFEVDPEGPTDRARCWSQGTWHKHPLTNDEIRLHPLAEDVEPVLVEAVETFWEEIR